MKTVELEQRVTEEEVLHEVIEVQPGCGTLTASVDFIMRKYAGHRLCRAKLLQLAQEYVLRDH